VANLKGAIYMIKGDRRTPVPPSRRRGPEIGLLPGYYQPGAPGRAGQEVRCAKQRFEKLLEKDKNNFGAMAALGDLAMLQKHTDEATSWYRKRQRCQSGGHRPALKLGMHYLQTKQAPKALTWRASSSLRIRPMPKCSSCSARPRWQPRTTGALETYSKLATAAEIAAGADAPGRRPHAPAEQRRCSRRPQACSRTAAGLRSCAPGQIELAMRNKRPEEALDMARQLQKQNAKLPVGYAVEGDLHDGAEQAGPGPARLRKGAIDQQAAPELIRSRRCRQ
jgi:hypothetical protein